MLKSTLILLLSGLTQTEFKKFGKFLQSPYFNSNKKVIEFYEILKVHYPEFNSLEISKENIYRKIYKTDNVVMGTMYYLISEIEGLLEKFISIERIAPLTLEMTYLSELDGMRLDNLFDVKLRKIEKELKKIYDPKNLNNFILSEIKRHNKIERKEFLTGKDTFKKEWNEPLDELIKLFLKNMLWNIELFSNFKNVLNAKIEIPFYDEILNYIKNSKKFDNDIEIKLSYYLILLHKEPDDKYYFFLKKLLKDNFKKISDERIRELLASLNNYCQKKIIEGHSFHEEQFEMQNIYIKHFLEERKENIPVDVFNQMFLLGIGVEKIDWAKKFVDKYSKRLEVKFQNNATHYSYACLYYQDKQYDLAMKELSSIKHYSYIHYKPGVKILQMKIYFDLGLLSEAEDTANSFVQFLRSDKLVTDNIKKLYFDFIKTFRKLLIAGSIPNLKNINALKFELARTNFLVSKIWLTQKAEDIEKKLQKNKNRKAI